MTARYFSLVFCVCFLAAAAYAQPVPSAAELIGDPTVGIPPVDYRGLPNLPNHPNADEPAGFDEQTLRVAFVGNTLIERMSEFSFLEAELIRLQPNRKMTFRNLGWPGDDAGGSARVEFGPGERDSSDWQRPKGTTHQYGFLKLLDQIRREQPHILFLGYGSNVAFGGEVGVGEFANGLDKLLDMLEPTGAHVILLAPPPREARGRLAAVLTQQNERLEAVANHLATVARDRGTSFVDLFHLWPPTTKQRYTDNGIHLNAFGYQMLATLVVNHLGAADKGWQLELDKLGATMDHRSTTAVNARATEYGFRLDVLDERLPSVLQRERREVIVHDLPDGIYTLDIDGQRVARATAREWAQGVAITAGPDVRRVESLLAAVREKNRLHFYGFRPQNKAYTHLFRRHERGQHAAEIDRFELLIKSAEKDIARLVKPTRRIYELVRESYYPDHEVPGEAVLPNVERELAAFTVPDGFEISLFAADPLISKPINMNWDEKGRLWVASSAIYPHLQPGQTPDDKILILEDLDRDGRADTSRVYADGLLIPQSVLPAQGGVYVTQCTDLVFLPDADGDGRADSKQVVFTGFGNADVHQTIHGLRWGPGGDIYFLQSIYINSVIETPWGRRTSNGSCIWRLRPETLQLEMYSQGLVNPWGLAFDRWGQSFASDGAGGDGPTYVFPGSAHETHEYGGRLLSAMNPGRPKECGLDILSGRHLPESWRGTLLTNDFRANRVTRYRLSDDNSGYRAKFLGDMVTSSHRGFRPVDVKMGPDGAIYIADWYNLIIDHGEVDFHHPLRDKKHGRIWRLSVKDSPPLNRPKLAGATVQELLDSLGSEEQLTRQHARRLLSSRDPSDVVPALRDWQAAGGLTEHQQLQALWVYQGLREAEPDLLGRLLRSPNHKIRAAAVRVLNDWQESLAAELSLELLSAAIEDEHPRVRLEAIHALRHRKSRLGVELAMRALDKPVDAALDFALFRTAHELRDEWLAGVQGGERMFDNQPHRMAFALSAVGGQPALAPLSQLLRSGQLPPGQRFDALTVLATSGGPPERALVLDHLRQLRSDDQLALLDALARAPRGRGPENSTALIRLLNDEHTELRTRAAQLAGRWRLAAAFEPLMERVTSSGITLGERRAAAEALVEVDPSAGAAALKELLETGPPPPIAAASVAALTRTSVAEAAPLAAALLRNASETDMAGLIGTAFLDRRDGPAALASALARTELSAPIAQAVLDEVRLSGIEQPRLEAAIRRAGKLEPRRGELSTAEFAAILRAVPRGDASRGSQIFRREKLQCVGCHAIGGEGGLVGPDLSSVGGSARVADILQSLAQPSAAIKQGYQTAQVITVDGRIITGILQQQAETHTLIRDSKNQLQTIPADDIDEIIPSSLSIMPVGLVEVLSQDELVDLVKYLSELGRG